MPLKDLPIGVQTFRDIVQGNFLYVDKTRHLYPLVRPKKGAYFLSRPRRFGKSLTLSTLEEIFLGNKDLFEGTWIAQSGYYWQAHPILRFDFNAYASHISLESFLNKKLDTLANCYDIALDPEVTASERFEELITKVAKTDQVVILVDEYDAPITKVIEDHKRTLEHRDRLKSFFSVLKVCDRYIRFVFITGVSKFTKVGIFSDLNHLNDITMRADFADLLGWTQSELVDNFTPFIENLAQAQNLSFEETLEKIKFHYNGFQFTENPIQLYNPFSTLLLFDSNQFKNYWFETGIPSFLVKMMEEKGKTPIDIENIILQEDDFSSLDVENRQLFPLLFQTGFLTITNYDPEEDEYTLDYPNLEVRRGFSKLLLLAFTSWDTDKSRSYLRSFAKALKSADMDLFFQSLKIAFSNLPYDLHIPEERFYQAIFHMIFTTLGETILSEVKTNTGRIDAVLKTPTHVFVFEFKFDKTAQAALDQIRKNRYCEPYLGDSKTVIAIGANFDRVQRNVNEYIVKVVTS